MKNRYKYLEYSLFLFIILGVVINFLSISHDNIPQGAEDGRLTSLLLQNEKNTGFKNESFDRINDSAVLRAFILTCREFYSHKIINVQNDIFKDSLLNLAGFKNIIYKKNYNLDLDLTSTILKSASRSIFYNPIIFSSDNYKKIRRYPLSTSPEFKMEYPKMILFIENDCGESNINVEILGRYAVFAPSGYFENLMNGEF